MSSNKAPETKSGTAQ